MLRKLVCIMRKCGVSRVDSCFFSKAVFMTESRYLISRPIYHPLTLVCATPPQMFPPVKTITARGRRGDSNYKTYIIIRNSMSSSLPSLALVSSILGTNDSQQESRYTGVS